VSSAKAARTAVRGWQYYLSINGPSHQCVDSNDWAESTGAFGSIVADDRRHHDGARMIEVEGGSNVQEGRGGAGWSLLESARRKQLGEKESLSSLDIT